MERLVDTGFRWIFAWKCEPYPLFTLVVVHSNTVPAILKSLGHAPVVTVGEEDFDNLFIVTMQPSGAPTLVHLKY